MWNKDKRLVLLQDANDPNQYAVGSMNSRPKSLRGARKIATLAIAVAILIFIALAYNGLYQTQRQTVIIVGNKEYDPASHSHIVSASGSNTIEYRVEGEALWSSLQPTVTYSITYYGGYIPSMGIYPTVTNATRIAPPDARYLGSNPEHHPYPYPSPPESPVGQVFGVKGDIRAVSEEWELSSGSPLLQPTWLPVGLERTAVYVLRSDATANKGNITQVTFLYSYFSDDDPYTAELQLRVQMDRRTPWMSPLSMRNNGTWGGGSYRELNGYPGYVGSIGWYEGGYYEMYSGYTWVASVEVGGVVYFMRAPPGITMTDLAEVASSLRQVQFH